MKSDCFAGRSGEHHHKAVLTDEKVREIRRQLEIGVSCLILANRFGVSPSTIRGIKIGRYWKHV